LRIHIFVLSGARAGQAYTFRQARVTAGRHPENDLQFDSRMDLEVSARHATIELDGDDWLVRDAGSRNGTYLNGVPVLEPTRLRSGDHVTFGRTGPSVEIRLIDADALERTVLAPAQPAAAPLAARESSSGVRRIGAVVAQQTRSLRVVAGALFVVVVAGGVLAWWGLREQRGRWTEERVAMQARLDSAALANERALGEMQAEVAQLADALRRAHDELSATQARLAQAGGRPDTSQIPALRRSLQSATAALNRHQLSGAIDFQAIQQSNRRAIAIVYVEYDDGEVTAGTAFAVQRNATFLTNQHVLSGRDGSKTPRRVAIQFADSEQVWPARILAISDDSDLGVVKVDNIIGGVPTVRALNLRSDTVAAGTAVAMLGFPLGGDSWTPGAASARFPRPLLSTGVVRSVRRDLLEIQGYGESGASGSPIFDANGEVVAILFGGRRAEGEAQTLVAIPASAAIRLLRSLD
jgi:S1-C subfamily serine protease